MIMILRLRITCLDPLQEALPCLTPDPLIVEIIGVPPEAGEVTVQLTRLMQHDLLRIQGKMDWLDLLNNRSIKTKIWCNGRCLTYLGMGLWLYISMFLYFSMLVCLQEYSLLSILGISLCLYL